MRRTLLALCAAVGLLAGGCGAQQHAGGGPTTATVATVPLHDPTTTTTSTTVAPTTTVRSTTTTTVPDTAVVPRHITAAYVDAVLAKLNHVYGDAVRSTVAAKRLTGTAYRDLAAIYTPSLAAEEQKIFAQATGDGGLRNIRAHPGDRRMVIRKLISASDSCVFARVRTSFHHVDLHPVKPPADEYVGLRRSPRGSVTASVNGTPWMIFFDLTNARFTSIRDQCRGG